MSRARRRRVGLVALTVAAAVAFWAIMFVAVERRKRPLTPASTASAAPAVPPTGAVNGLDEDVPGVLFSTSSVDVAPTIEGRITTVNVKVGDHVAANVILATLDDRQHKDQLAVAEAGRRAASAEVGRASVELVQARDRRDRRVGTVKVGDDAIAVVSAEEVAESKHSARAAGARATAAGAVAGEQAARVRALKTALGETQLRAPFAGVVATVYVGPGSFVRPGMPALRIIDAHSLSVRFAVAEENARSIRTGGRLSIRLDARTLGGQISTIAPEVEPSSRTVFVEGTLDLDADASKIAALSGRVVRVATAP